MKVLARDVLDFVAADHGLTVADLRARCRTNKYARPRMIAMHMTRILCPHMSYPAIGALLDRDHTTVLSGDRRIASLRYSDPEIRAAVARVDQRFAEQAHEARVLAAAIQFQALCASYGQAMRRAA